MLPSLQTLEAATCCNMIRVRRLPTGRRSFALSRVRALCLSKIERLSQSSEEAAVLSIATYQELLRRCELGLEQEARTAELKASRARTRRRRRLNGGGPSQAMLIDQMLDRAVSALDAKIASEVEAHPPDAPEAEQLKELRIQLFPAGVIAVTSAPYVEELGLVSTLLEKCIAHQAQLERLGCSGLIRRLGTLVAEYSEAISSVEEQGPSGKDIDVAETRGATLLASSVAYILAMTPEETDSAQFQERQRLLAPILQQDEAVARASRHRRRAKDVDPESGLELDAAEASVEKSVDSVHASESDPAEANLETSVDSVQESAAS